jgi:hypothetical protein
MCAAQWSCRPDAFFVDMDTGDVRGACAGRAIRWSVMDIIAASMHGASIGITADASERLLQDCNASQASSDAVRDVPGATVLRPSAAPRDQRNQSMRFGDPAPIDCNRPVAGLLISRMASSPRA